MYEVNAIILLAAFQPKSLFRFGFKMEGSKKLTSITYHACGLFFDMHTNHHHVIITLYHLAGIEVCLYLSYNSIGYKCGQKQPM